MSPAASCHLSSAASAVATTIAREAFAPPIAIATAAPGHCPALLRPAARILLHVLFNSRGWWADFVKGCWVRVGLGIDFIQGAGPSGSVGALGVMWKLLMIFLAFGMAGQRALVALGRAAPFPPQNYGVVKTPQPRSVGLGGAHSSEKESPQQKSVRKR